MALLRRLRPPRCGRIAVHLASAVSIPRFEAELAAFASEMSAGPRKQIVLVLELAGGHTQPYARTCAPALPRRLPPPELQPAEHPWPLNNTALAYHHFVTIDDLDNTQAARCIALQVRLDLIRSATRIDC